VCCQFSISRTVSSYLIQDMHPVRIPWARHVSQDYPTFLKFSQHQVSITREKSSRNRMEDYKNQIHPKNTGIQPYLLPFKSDNGKLNRCSKHQTYKGYALSYMVMILLKQNE